MLYLYIVEAAKVGSEQIPSEDQGRRHNIASQIGHSPSVRLCGPALQLHQSERANFVYYYHFCYSCYRSPSTKRSGHRSHQVRNTALRTPLWSQAFDAIFNIPLVP